ncbi:hypothetical protein DUI87_23177 [Hirundo rustica rustica]|uniref:Uncharacterized protein n=1 Tax=Hirundo rustica rustica TaxID=333673 RepID=A0A3M0JJS4_HIRRU|nr:hypothetical protein DUI87_23177 [Hirundo rustica rustica]
MLCARRTLVLPDSRKRTSQVVHSGTLRTTVFKSTMAEVKGFGLCQYNEYKRKREVIEMMMPTSQREFRFTDKHPESRAEYMPEGFNGRKKDSIAEEWSGKRELEEVAHARVMTTIAGLLPNLSYYCYYRVAFSELHGNKKNLHPQDVTSSDTPYGDIQKWKSLGDQLNLALRGWPTTIPPFLKLMDPDSKGQETEFLLVPISQKVAQGK